MASTSISTKGSTILPQPLTVTYKTISRISIQADVYLPSVPAAAPSPVLLYLHGGGWVYGTRRNIPVTFLHEFLQRGFVVVSADYRLLPESDFLTGQLEDIRDLEDWLRRMLPGLVMQSADIRVDSEAIVVLGASAGAHLALLTPKIWQRSPAAIISMYGPTNLVSLVAVKRGGFKDLTLPPMTSNMLNAALLDPPPTEFPDPSGASNLFSARSMMSLAVIGNNITGEFLIRGLVDGLLPAKGSTTETEIKKISPYFLAEDIAYPPVFQAIGTEDEAFDASQVTTFDDQLKKFRVDRMTMIFEGKHHSFDMKSLIGDEVHLSVMSPAADFVERYARKRGRDDQEYSS